jgi:hypothetical protein
MTNLKEIDKQFYRYCCLDSCVTYEINNYLEPRIKGTAKEQYDFNVKMLLPLRYMEMRGILYDEKGAATRRELLRQKMFETQAKFNAITGFGFSFTSKKEITDRAKQVMLTKDESRPRKEYIELWERFQELLKLRSPNLASIGELEDLCDVSLNEGSKRILDYLYNELHLPVQLSEPNKQKGGEQHPTADYEACLNLSKYCQKNNLQTEYQIIQLIITLRALDTRQRMLSISADKDHRIRCGYNIVGSETGRITCYTSPTGSGYNLQTIPKHTNPVEAPGGVIGDRDLFLADEGYYVFECDLEGADSWTVAAYCAMLGDFTMLTDLQSGIRPAKRICLKMRGVDIDYHNPAAVLEASKKVLKTDLDYFASKRVVHGGSYLEGAHTIGRNVLKDSEGKTYLSDGECNALKNLLIKECYPGIPRYHQYIGRQLAVRQVLTAASGQVRQFFGRPDEILTKAVAFEPQANTTYATNLAMWNLWSDAENRRKGRLIIEPLHQVHDALIGQFKITDTDWAVKKIKSYFTNELVIAGQKITIPFEGGYGTSWGCLKKGEIK